MMDLSNETNISQELICYGIPVSILVFNSEIYITLMGLNILISITASVGNLFVLVTIWRSLHLHSPSNTLLFGLAMSDLCVGLVSEPLTVGFQAVLFKNSSKITSCTLVKTLSLTSTFLTAVTLLTVTAMSVDRYLAIYLHLRYDQMVTEKRTRKVILFLWFISSVPSVIMVFDSMTSYLVMILIITLCLVIITFAWIKIYQVVRHHQAQIQDQMAVASQSFNMARFKNSAINTMLVLVIVLLCYTPFLVSKICLTVNLNRSNVLFFEISLTFVLLNSSLNPLVYFWRQRDLRAQAKQLVMTFCCQTQ
ncbi:melanocyte-stimulating hormone receptor-like [Orbicella faveolata]|uniref:melanocyte-stimulating hormone receptor-like n=1 Tax=Orbicella faveolata TaxID=48498 RepID=UPI0009E51BDA|nr:melanocyte-stimulating hormone receptor-like [Orbicella faveolata]